MWYKKKHVLPALIVPGPNKPKNLDSFMFQGFHHVSALQRENSGAGLRVWDAINTEIINSHVIVILAGADAVGLTELDGRVGHHGAHGCRIGCGMQYFTLPHTIRTNSNLSPSKKKKKQDVRFLVILSHSESF